MTMVKKGGERAGSKDISNKAVLVMLILVILVTAVSLLIYLQALEKAKPKVIVNEGKAVGEVTLTILPPPQTANSAQGEVSLTIVKPKEAAGQ